MDERQLTRLLALGRLTVGTALTVLPGPAGGRWIGADARHASVKVMIRGLGVRDAAIGAGTYLALADGRPARTWIQAGIASDAVDAVASLLAIRQIGLARALPAMLVAGGAAALGVWLADRVD